MDGILVISLLIVIGMALGAICRRHSSFLVLAGKTATWTVYPLLFLLGAGLGADHDLLARLPALGGKALCITLCAILGSALCLRWLGKFMGLRGKHPEHASEGNTPGQETAASLSPFWGTAGILCALAAGCALSYAGWLAPRIYEGSFALYALWLLIFAIGICLGGEPNTWRIVRDMGPRILLVPVCIIAGTALGSAAAALILPELSLRDAFAVGAGFGYYSLSSLLIDQLGNPPLAAVALLANLFREILGMLTAPFLVRLFGPLAPVGAAGATAMDTCLPVIIRFSGERCAIAAVFSGMVLTLLTPFFVTFIMTW